MKIRISSIFYMLGFVPWMFIISLLTFYLFAINHLGQLPTLGNPDPKELNIYGLMSPIINFTGVISFFSLIVWTLFSIIHLITIRKQIEWTPLILSGIGQVFGIVLFLSKIFEWYID